MTDRVNTKAFEEIKTRVARAFDAAAAGYDDAARIQARAAKFLASEVGSFLDFVPQRIVDLGCGTGFVVEALAARYSAASLLACDISPLMIEQTRARIAKLATDQRRFAYAVCDAEYAKFTPRPDLIASSLCAQWFDDFDEAILRIARSSTISAHAVLLDGSFASWIAAHERRGISHGMRPLPTAARCIAVAANMGAVRYAFRVEQFLDRRADAIQFPRDLRAIGASVGTDEFRARSLRRIMRDFPDGYAAEYCVGFLLIDMRGARPSFG